MSKIKINVTQEDINNARRFSCTHCPIALAVQRLGFHDVGVGEDDDRNQVIQSTNLILTDGKEEVKTIRANLPEEAIDFIVAFDSIDLQTVKPFSFEVDFQPYKK